jgi:hypothetical protein
MSQCESRFHYDSFSPIRPAFSSAPSCNVHANNFGYRSEVASLTLLGWLCACKVLNGSLRALGASYGTRFSPRYAINFNVPIRLAARRSSGVTEKSNLCQFSNTCGSEFNSTRQGVNDNEQRTRSRNDVRVSQECPVTAFIMVERTMVAIPADLNGGFDQARPVRTVLRSFSRQRHTPRNGAADPNSCDILSIPFPASKSVASSSSCGNGSRTKCSSKR